MTARSARRGGVDGERSLATNSGPLPHELTRPCSLSPPLSQAGLAADDTAGRAALLAAAAASASADAVIELTEDGGSVRRREPLPADGSADVAARTLYIKVRS